MAKDTSGAGFWPAGFWAPAAQFTPEECAARAARYRKANPTAKPIACDDCGSRDVSILGGFCRRCGESLSGREHLTAAGD